MKYAVIILASSLAACSGGELSKSEIAGLSATSDMPKGSAEYQGQVEIAYAGADVTGKDTGDVTLNANFDDSTFTTKVSNIETKGTFSGIDMEIAYDGALHGNGQINDNFFEGSVEGTVAIASAKVNGKDNAEAKGNTLTYDPVYFGGYFVGDEAEAIYGKSTNTEDGITITSTLWGNKQ